MQRQQEREPATRQKPSRARRSVGELLAAWLLVLWGAVCAWVGFTLLFTTDIGRWSPRTLLLHGVSCLTGGILTFFRFSGFATWLLWGASVSSVIFGVLFLYNEPNAWVLRWRLDLSFTNFLAAAICVTFAILLLFLGRWIGRQEDIEA